MQNDDDEARRDELNAASHRRHRGPRRSSSLAFLQWSDTSVPNRSSAALAGESGLQWQRVVIIDSGATTVRLLPAMPSPPRT